MRQPHPGSLTREQGDGVEARLEGAEFDFGPEFPYPGQRTGAPGTPEYYPTRRS